MELEKENQPQVSRRKEATEIRAKIFFLKKGINESKTWFLEKRNKIDKTLARFMKKKRERTQINKIRNEKEFTIDTTEIQRIIRDY